MTRLKARYDSEIVPAMMERFRFVNKLAVPRIEKIVVNMGLGKASQDKKIAEDAMSELSLITGQRPAMTRARKDIANFKIRKGSIVGCKVTLRKKIMYEFLDRLISIAIPRIKDFRGLSPNSFDGRGNYAFGLVEETVFPELDADKVKLIKGMDIIIQTTAAADDEARELLRLFGLPFRTKQI